MMELLVPCGDMETLKVAVNAGADAVYLGGKKFGARAFSKNFTDEEMIEAIKYAHLYGVKVHVTVNTMIYEEELNDALDYLGFLYKNGVDAVIMQDIGLINLAHQKYPELEIHASTQMHNTSIDQIKFLEELGVKRVVFAREVSLDDIDFIDTKLDKEIFIHGSLCVSYSGECLFSSIIMNRSGNRGECAQMCRLPYKLKENDKFIKTNGDYLLSPKDLNTSKYFERIMNSSVKSLKIEGRMKSPEYVGCVTRLYRDLIDKYYEHKKIEVNYEYYNDLKVIFNREYTKGYLLNEDSNDLMNIKSSSHKGILLGNIINTNKKYVVIKLVNDLHQGDGIRFNDINSGMIVNYLYDRHGKLINSAKSNDIIMLDNKFNIKNNYSVNKTFDINIKNKYINTNIRKIKINLDIKGNIGSNLTCTISDGINNITESYGLIQESINRPVSKEEIIKHLTKFGNTTFVIDKINIDIDNNIFINIKDINELRRLLVDELINKRENINLNRPINNNINTKYLSKYDNNINLSVLVNTEEQYNALNKYNIKRIYISNISLYLKHKNDNNIYYRTLRVNNNIKNNNKTLDTDTGSLYVNHGIADYYLNIANHETINYLSKYSNISTLSIELTDNTINNIMKYNNKINTELVIYTRPELMIMKYCPLKLLVNKDNKCHVCTSNNKYYLVDRNNKEYPIIEDSNIHLTHILNYKVINKINNINYYKNIGINNYRIELYDEDYNTTCKLLDSIIKELYE